MVKGYSGYYNKIYNQYSKPTFSVGEYFDSNYDAVTGWIEATGKESAAFDFPFKYAVNEAFHSGDLTKLVWQAPGYNNQPAGLIHYGYSQLAVTFIDNHDTYRDGSKFNGNVMAANAFMLCSPGTPCVFYPHWTAHKSELKKIIEIRNAVGVHNNSHVTVLKSSYNCYMAEVTGTKGKLVVKVGGAMESPSGYTNDDIKASGNDYCIWVKTSDQGDGSYPANLYIIGDLNGWSTTSSIAADSKLDGVYTWNNVDLKAAKNSTDSYFSFVTAQGADWNVVNGSDRYGAMSSDEAISSTAGLQLFPAGTVASTAYSWKAPAAQYKVVADLKNKTVTITKTGESIGGGDDDDDSGDYPARLYIIGNLNNWGTSTSVASDSGKSGVYTWNEVKFPAAANDTYSYFSFVTAQGADWNAVNGSDRYGATSKDAVISSSADMKIFKANVDASAANSWKATPGTYKVVADLKNLTVTISEVEEGGGDGDDSDNYPTMLYIIGNLNGWTTSTSVAADSSMAGEYVWNSVDLLPAKDSTDSYFSFVTAQGADWNAVNSSDRYGAASKDEVLATTAKIQLFKEGVNASAANSWKVKAGIYKVIADLKNMTVTLSGTTGIGDIEAGAEDAEAVYYNMQGVRVDNPSAGLYIVVRGDKVTKEIVR